MPTSTPETAPNTIPRRFTLAYIAIMAVILSGVTLHALRAPGVYWIHDDDDAIWLRTGRSPNLGLNVEVDRGTRFRAQIDLQTIPDSAIATIETLRDFSVIINGESFHETDMQPQPGAITRIPVEIASHFRPGTNEIIIEVRHPLGPHLLKCAVPAINLYSDITWQYANPSGEWAPVVPATGHIDLQRKVLDTPLSLWIATAICITALMIWTIDKRKSLTGLIPPARLRFILMAMLLALGINNTFHLDLKVGMDAGHHYFYLDHMLENKTLPLASDGMWAFRSPLFYLIAILPYAVLNSLFEVDTAQVLIRIVPVLMSLGMVEMLYRILRDLYPEAPEKIAIGTLIGAFIPINLYLFQFPSDEPAAGLAGTLTLLVAMRLLQRNRPLSNRDGLLAGMTMGLAFLAKVSTALLAFPCLAVLIYCQLKQRPLKPAGFFKPIFIALVACFITSGWYYIRNMIHLGTPAVMGWDAQFAWWQFPGYRANSHLLSFGITLVNPIYAGATSFWDSLYSSLWADGWNSGVISLPSVWNFPLQRAAVWLALPLTVFMFAGLTAPITQMLTQSKNQDSFQNRALLLAVTLVLIYTAAIFHHFILFPAYSSAKSSYYIAILPCLIILILRGLDMFEARFGETPARCAHVFIVLWAIYSYSAFWVFTYEEIL